MPAFGVYSSRSGTQDGTCPPSHQNFKRLQANVWTPSSRGFWQMRTSLPNQDLLPKWGRWLRIAVLTLFGRFYWIQVIAVTARSPNESWLGSVYASWLAAAVTMVTAPPPTTTSQNDRGAEACAKLIVSKWSVSAELVLSLGPWAFSLSGVFFSFFAWCWGHNKHKRFAQTFCLLLVFPLKTFEPNTWDWERLLINDNEGRKITIQSCAHLLVQMSFIMLNILMILPIYHRLLVN